MVRENFDEIVEERVKLDQLRDEVTNERKNIVSRYEPPAPDVVLATRGYVNTKLFGKIAATVSVALLVVAGLLVVRIVRDFTDQFPIEYVDVNEAVDVGSCQWTVAATLRNDSDTTVNVTHMSTVLNSRSAGAAPVSYPTLPPGETAVATGVWTLRNAEGCPESADLVSHGNLVVHFKGGADLSSSFKVSEGF